MSTFKFAGLPSHSAVAATVTLVVSAWFTVAAASLAFDATEPDTRAASVQKADTYAKIVVTASRSAS
ncbi:MAG TPA: hypothetical protein VIR81_04630 [Myxococcales bacterium]